MWTVVALAVFGQLAVVDDAWTARFAPRDGWAGGDAVYSTRLADGRVLWLFADSFAGDVKEGSRAGSRFLNNTAAIQTGADADPKVSFFVAKNAAAEPVTWIAPSDGRGWFWPAAPVATDRGVVVCLWRIEKAGDGAFGFRQIGCDLAIVDDTSGEPAEWKLVQRPLPFCKVDDETSISFGSASVFHDGFAYVYGVRENQRPGAFPDKHAILARVNLGAIAVPTEWRFFAGVDKSKTARWSERIGDAVSVLQDAVNEFSVSWDAPRNRWVMIAHESFLGPRIVARTAAELMGPWSEATPIFTCPEPARDERVFVYAAKGHPEIDLGLPDELLITYATNSRDFGHLLGDARVYVPQAIRVRLNELK